MGSPLHLEFVRTDMRRPVAILTCAAERIHPQQAFEFLLRSPVWRDALHDPARAVDLARLPVIVRTGIDVEPPSAPFFAGEFEKALEYGGESKAVQFFHGAQLDRSFVEVLSSESASQLAALRREYRAEFTSEDGAHLWFSRFPASDRRACSPYEAAYGRCLRSDPFSALRGLLLVGSDPARLRASFEGAVHVAGEASRHWA